MQRSLVIKMVTIVVMGALLLIPVSMVRYKLYERQDYLLQARSAVASSLTGQQELISPVLVIPYRLSPVSQSGFYTESSPPPSAKLELLMPEALQGEIQVDNKRLFKGIYEVPVYNSDITLTGQFSADNIRQQINRIKQLPHFDSLGVPYLSVHVTDMRGIDQRPSLTVNGRSVLLDPGSGLSSITAGLHGELSNLLEPIETMDFSLRLSLRGMGSLAFVQLADDANITMRSDWPHPEFIGAFLPAEREVSPSGFSARWSSTRYSGDSLNLLQQCVQVGSCKPLFKASSGVNFIKPVNVYLQSERAIKYAVLFIGLSFVTFFIFEHLKRVRIHPIQYAFVGLAMAVFYLLLISLAEHIAFIRAYAISVLCCLALILFYVRYMLKSLVAALLFTLMLLGLYSLLYVIVQAEDFALLMGAVLVFGVLTALMYVTREIDWYQLSETDDGPVS